MHEIFVSVCRKLKAKQTISQPSRKGWGNSLALNPRWLISGQRAYSGMQAFLINLARRPRPKLRNMTAQLADLDITTQRVNAIDAKHTCRTPSQTRRFSTDGPLGPIPKGDKCCTLSHMRAWRAFLASGESHGLILEDDVAVDPQGAPMLRDAGWIPPSVGLLKIEHYGPENQRVLLGEMIDAGRRAPDRVQAALAPYRRSCLHRLDAPDGAAMLSGMVLHPGRCRSTTCCSIRTIRR